MDTMIQGNLRTELKMYKESPSVFELINIKPLIEVSLKI